MDNAHIIWAFQWLLYCFIHSFLANHYIKIHGSRLLNISSQGYRIIYNVIAFVHLAILIWFHLSLKSEILFAGNTFSTAIAITMVGLGLIIMFFCILKYFKQLSGAFQALSSPKLYTKGLHGLVRHPLYLGTFLFLLGALLYWPLMKNVVAVTIIIGYTLLGILLEEKKLRDEFGEAYTTYSEKVPMIIPWLKSFQKKKTHSTTGSVP